MKRILAFSFFPAFVPPSNGGESRLFGFYSSLSEFHHVTLLSSTHQDVPEDTVQHGANFVERRIPKDQSFTAAWRELSPLSSGGDMSAPCILYSARIPNRLQEAYLDEYAYADVIIHDSPFTLPYDLFFGLDGKLRIYNAYNCESGLYRTLHPDPRSRPIWDLVEVAETRLLRGCDAVFYCSSDDLHEFDRLAPDASYSRIFVPNGFAPWLERKIEQAKPDRVRNLVFMGSAHPPNVDAAQRIVQQLAPVLPQYTFHLIGNCLPKGRYPRNVIRHGFIGEEEKAEVLNKADLAINPMSLGSGSNLKVFDYLAHGIPVLTTEFGIRGIDVVDGVDCVIAQSQDFARQIESWASRHDELREIGRNGQRLASERYTWDQIAARAADALNEVKHHPRWTSPYVLVLNDYDSFENTGGGGVRTRGIYAAVNEWAPVVLMCFSDSDELQAEAVNENTLLFRIPKTSEHKEELRQARLEHAIAIDDIIAHRECRSNRLFVGIYNVLKRHCRSIVVEHPYLATLPISHHDRFVYSSQNNEAQMKSALLKSHPRYEQLIREVQALERAAIQSSSTVIAVSAADAESFTRRARSVGPVVVVPNGAGQPATPTEQERTIAREEAQGRPAVVFVGSGHKPNIDAARYIVDCLAPLHPGVLFHLVGSVCNAFDSIATDNVRSWGVISDSMKSAVMQSCCIGLNPVISGGGSNIKLADYLANGLLVLTTPFGIRGYPEKARAHVLLADLPDFAGQLELALSTVRTQSDRAVEARRQFFLEELSMKALGGRFVDQLRILELPKRKVLFVTYRYTEPALGGAESMLAHLVGAINGTNAYQIDVVAAEVSAMRNVNRFSEDYEFGENTAAPIGMSNVRFARFPVSDARKPERLLRRAWGVQPLFEKALHRNLEAHFGRSGLAWGWGDPEEVQAHGPSRWGFTSCALYLHQEGAIRISGMAPAPIVVWIKDRQGRLIRNAKLNGRFVLEFSAPQGSAELSVSTPFVDRHDPRPLAFLMFRLEINGSDIDLRNPPLQKSVDIDHSDRFFALDKACLETRSAHSIRLTDMRGPHCPELEDFLHSNIGRYDLVVTHNTIFRPAVAAVEHAKASGVPVVVIPHAHLDDDFYHFPDVHGSVVQSDLVLAAPKACCDFYRNKGATVAYLPAGIDTNEVFSEGDVEAFESVCSVDKPFILVLGRKAGAKGYQSVIQAVGKLAQSMAIHLVMIGPDDDGVPLRSRHVNYLGRQPRCVVRGALSRCRAVVNMSASESFGIVILEAWMAGKPVVVNQNCPAFHDLAAHEDNALMVDGAEQLEHALRRLWSDPDLCRSLSTHGKQKAMAYDWARIGADFIRSCESLITASA